MGSCLRPVILADAAMLITSMLHHMTGRLPASTNTATASMKPCQLASSISPGAAAPGGCWRSGAMLKPPCPLSSIPWRLGSLLIRVPT